jgi:hypothetical protein
MSEKNEAAFEAEVNEGKILDNTLKTPEQIQKEEQIKALEAKQEKIVINAREIILPILKDNNSSVNNSKMACDVLQIAISQGQFELLKKHKVDDLKLLDLIKEDYPESKIIRGILEKIGDLSMEEGISALQWMVEKMNKVIEDENKDRKFEDLKLDF